MKSLTENPRAVAGSNLPPDPIDEALAPFGDYIAEAEAWLDGEPVKDEGQMKAVDDLLTQIKAASKSVSDAEKSACLPLHDAWKAEKARWKPTLDDLDKIKKGLTSIVNDFKRKLAAEREAERRAAEAEARRKQEEAERAAKAAQASDIVALREAEAKAVEAAEATKAAKRVEQVKGLRTVTLYEIDDHRAALHWIAKHEREAITAFIDEHVRRRHKAWFADGVVPDGVRVWQDKEAF